MTKQSKLIGFAYAVTSIILGTSMFIACKIAYTATLGGFSLLFFRYALAILALILIYRKRPKPKLSQKDKKRLLFIGVFGYWFSISLVLLGTDLCTASTASIISSLNPIGMVIFARIILKERITANKGLGVFFAVLGSIVVIGSVGDGNTTMGIIISFASMVGWALTSVYIRKTCAAVDPVWLTIYVTAIGMVCDIPFAIVEMVVIDFDIYSFNATSVFAVVWIALIATAGANLWWNKALEILPAATCSLTFSLMPVVSTILGAIVLKEIPTMRLVAGCLIIVTGILTALLSDK